jgi:hypothetical protein
VLGALNPVRLYDSDAEVYAQVAASAREKNVRRFARQRGTMPQGSLNISAAADVAQRGFAAKRWRFPVKYFRRP